MVTISLFICIIKSRIITISLMIINCDLMSTGLRKRAGNYIFDRLGEAPLK